MDASLLDDIKTFTPKHTNRRFNKVLIIGCGGTGAYVAAHLARFIKGAGSGTTMVLADGDVVEEKNLERQHFVAGDLGKNKAEVIADRYSAAFGLEISAISAEIRSANDADGIFDGGSGLVVGCVDNNASRKMMYKWLLKPTRPANLYYDDGKFWIDAGNEERGGQVICGYAPPSEAPYVDKKHFFSMPTVMELYPELDEEDAKFNSDAGCAENAVSEPQNMMANVTAATIVMNFLQKILLKQDMVSHGVVFSIDNSFRTLFNTADNLAKVDPKRLRGWEEGRQ